MDPGPSPITRRARCMQVEGGTTHANEVGLANANLLPAAGTVVDLTCYQPVIKNMMRLRLLQTVRLTTKTERLILHGILHVRDDQNRPMKYNRNQVLVVDSQCLKEEQSSTMDASTTTTTMTSSSNHRRNRRNKKDRWIEGCRSQRTGSHTTHRPVVRLNRLKLLWKSSETGLKLLWKSSETALKLLWKSSEKKSSFRLLDENLKLPFFSDDFQTIFREFSESFQTIYKDGPLCL